MSRRAPANVKRIKVPPCPDRRRILLGNQEKRGCPPRTGWMRFQFVFQLSSTSEKEQRLLGEGTNDRRTTATGAEGGGFWRGLFFSFSLIFWLSRGWDASRTGMGRRQTPPFLNKKKKYERTSKNPEDVVYMPLARHGSGQAVDGFSFPLGLGIPSICKSSRN